MEVRPGYKQTEVGIIPEDWDVAKLAEVCSMKSGEGITSVSIDHSSKYPCYGGNGLRGFTSRFTHDGKYALIGRQGALCGNVLGVEGKFFASEHAVVVTASLRTDIGWLTFVLGEMRLNQYSESSAQPGLSVSKLLSFNLALPPTIAEQEAIAKTLSDVDALIESLEQLIAKKYQLKRGVMQELLTGKRRLPGFSGEWEVKRLGEIADLKNGYAFKSEAYTSLGFFSVVTIANVQAGYMDITECNKINVLPRDLQPHHRLLIGDLLISMTGNVGRVCRVTVNNCLLNQRVGKLVPSLVESSFLYPLLSQRSFLTAMGNKAKGGAQGNLSVSDILEYEFLIPTQNIEQTAIAEILSDMDAEIAALERKRDKTRLLKQGMMQELLTGRIRLV